MPLPLSKNQIGKLGQRLRAGDPPAREDLDTLHDLLAHYGDVLDRATSTVREATGLAPTARVKNTGTILEKLRRQGGSSLKTMQDLAGMRIVGDFDRNGQDAVANDLVALFDDGSRVPRVVDRRAKPVNGYRAVHVIVFPEGTPVEVQVRTRAQHEWAELFEKLADRVGRGIRYGKPPTPGMTAQDLANAGDDAGDLYDAKYEFRLITIRVALAAAELIDVVEQAEQQEPNSPDLPEYRAKVAKAIGDLASDLQRVG